MNNKSFEFKIGVIVPALVVSLKLEKQTAL